MIENRTVRTTAQRPARPTDARRPGFTLIELLVVILVILLVSAVTLPSIISAISHRQVSEAARILQGALVGARDSAIHNNAPSGIRLLPDPTINGINPTTGALDPTLPMAMSRIIPLESAPDYDDGTISIIRDLPGYPPFTNPPWAYPAPTSPWAYPYPTATTHFPVNPVTGHPISVLMVEECPIDTSQLPAMVPNEPTSWFWNIRVGDKIRINNSGQSYTVIGPMVQANPELFVNDGPAGSAPLLYRSYNNSAAPLFQVEYLFLVNGLDDDNDGFIDNGWDGVDNDTINGIDDVNEWTEAEKWSGSLSGQLAPVEGTVTSLPAYNSLLQPFHTQGLLNQTYTITRRPIPTASARETALPSNVVIDLTTWATTHERSRFPLPPSGNGTGTSQVVNPNSGTVDIVVNPDGSVTPTTVYSSPSSFGINGSFLHFWLAERSDVAAPYLAGGTVVPSVTLPLPAGLAPTNFPSGAELKGEYSLVTVYSRTGQIMVSSPPRFDTPNLTTGAYNLNVPFVDAQQGVRGGIR